MKDLTWGNNGQRGNRRAEMSLEHSDQFGYRREYDLQCMSNGFHGFYDGEHICKASL